MRIVEGRHCGSFRRFLFETPFKVQKGDLLQVSLAATGEANPEPLIATGNSFVVDKNGLAHVLKAEGIKEIKSSVLGRYTLETPHDHCGCDNCKCDNKKAINEEVGESQNEPADWLKLTVEVTPSSIAQLTPQQALFIKNFIEKYAARGNQ